MKITKISQQKKASDRYSIYVDDKFLIGVSQEVLIQFGLYKDQEVDQAFLEELTKAENKYKVYAKAVNYLSYGLRSRKELRDYLFKQDFQVENPQVIIEDTLDRLTQQGYLNDLEFAKAYVRTMANINYKGPQVISRELKLKGIDENMILDSLLEYPHQLQMENIHHLAHKFIKTKRKTPPKMLEQKLTQHLLQKGYDKADIQEARENIEIEIDDDQQAELLDREANKLLKKHQRKYSGYDLKQRISQSLFGKGFDYQDIKNWLEDHQEEFDG